MSLTSRTTPELVAGIIEVDAKSIPDLSPFQEAAAVITKTVLLVPNGYVDGTDDEILAILEKWLAAHFYAIRDPRTTQEVAGKVGASFESKVDLGFALTRYGQTAMDLDSKRLLAAHNMLVNKGYRPVVPGVVWGGSHPQRRYGCP